MAFLYYVQDSHNNDFYRVSYASTVLAVITCLSVCLSVHHKMVKPRTIVQRHTIAQGFYRVNQKTGLFLEVCNCRIC